MSICVTCNNDKVGWQRDSSLLTPCNFFPVTDYTVVTCFLRKQFVILELQGSNNEALPRTEDETHKLERTRQSYMVT